jgi:hypothetical protein
MSERKQLICCCKKAEASVEEVVWVCKYSNKEFNGLTATLFYKQMQANNFKEITVLSSRSHPYVANGSPACPACRRLKQELPQDVLDELAKMGLTKDDVEVM